MRKRTQRDQGWSTWLHITLLSICMLGITSLPSALAKEAGQAEIQSHLSTVHHRLVTQTPNHFNGKQLKKRRRLLKVLKQYKKRGLFPKNRINPIGRPRQLAVPGGWEAEAGQTPVFVDEDGVHCAVGYLIHRSGRDDLVAQVVQSQNDFWLHEMQVEGLAEWAGEHGFTTDELAQIQPGYSTTEFQTFEAVSSIGVFALGTASLTLSLASEMDLNRIQGTKRHKAMTQQPKRAFQLATRSRNQAVAGLTLGILTMAASPMVVFIHAFDMFRGPGDELVLLTIPAALMGLAGSIISVHALSRGAKVRKKYRAFKGLVLKVGISPIHLKRPSEGLLVNAFARW